MADGNKTGSLLDGVDTSLVEKIRSECVSDWQRFGVEIMLAVLNRPCPKDGWLRQSTDARGWYEKALKAGDAKEQAEMAEVFKQIRERNARSSLADTLQ